MSRRLRSRPADTPELGRPLGVRRNPVAARRAARSRALGSREAGLGPKKNDPGPQAVVNTGRFHLDLAPLHRTCVGQRRRVDSKPTGSSMTSAVTFTGAAGNDRRGAFPTNAACGSLTASRRTIRSKRILKMPPRISIAAAMPGPPRGNQTGRRPRLMISRPKIATSDREPELREDAELEDHGSGTTRARAARAYSTRTGTVIR